MNDPIRKAHDALQAVMPKVKADPARPRYHFTAPANWMNDPNGTIYHDGYYHLFYQHHPFSDDWGPMHWGHARSTDLLTWEHLPIAIYPYGDGIENGIWSGCITFNKLNQPVAFYTCANFPASEGTEADFTQNAAIGSPDLIEWKKVSPPPLTRKGPAADYRSDWRDPFVFHSEGRTFMILGMTGKGVPIYEAIDDGFLEWEHRGMMTEKDAECPNFFELDGHWLYLWSPFNNVEYAIGDFDLNTLTFTPEISGRYDWSEHEHSDYYATNHLYAPDGRSILFGWIRGWKPGRGWSGAMGIPREVHIGADGILRTPPIAEMTSLRKPLMQKETLELTPGSTDLNIGPGTQYEISCSFSLNTAEKMEVGFCCSDDGHATHQLWLEADGFHLDGVHIPLEEKQLTRPLDVRFFVDHAVAEVFIDDGRYCAVRILKEYNPENTGLTLFAEGEGATLTDFQVWQIESTQE